MAPLQIRNINDVARSKNVKRKCTCAIHNGIRSGHKLTRVNEACTEAPVCTAISQNRWLLISKYDLCCFSSLYAYPF